MYTAQRVQRNMTKKKMTFSPFILLLLLVAIATRDTHWTIGPTIIAGIFEFIRSFGLS